MAITSPATADGRHRNNRQRIDVDTGKQPSLFCVPPDDARKFWPHVRKFILDAMVRGGGECCNVETDLFDGVSQLWIVWDGTKIIAAAITSLGIVNNEKTCTIVACGGDDLSCFGHFINDLEQFAKAEGCAAVRINGRLGWKRALNGYDLQSVVLRKGLI